LFTVPTFRGSRSAYVCSRAQQRPRSFEGRAERAASRCRRLSVGLLPRRRRRAKAKKENERLVNLCSGSILAAPDQTGAAVLAGWQLVAAAYRWRGALTAINCGARRLLGGACTAARCGRLACGCLFYPSEYHSISLDGSLRLSGSSIRVPRFVLFASAALRCIFYAARRRRRVLFSFKRTVRHRCGAARCGDMRTACAVRCLLPAGACLISSTPGCADGGGSGMLARRQGRAAFCRRVCSSLPATCRCHCRAPIHSATRAVVCDCCATASARKAAFYRARTALRWATSASPAAAAFCRCVACCSPL